MKRGRKKGVKTGCHKGSLVDQITRCKKGKCVWTETTAEQVQALASRNNLKLKTESFWILRLGERKITRLTKIQRLGAS